ncbi:C39 family peptidase [Paenibacillus solani]|uniref:C39 family peptidase n=1 Tax=Paenibacillus solani TaxID=1705565 RepID=UPI003D286E91
MILNIIPKKGEYADCRQHLLITVSEWWNRRYELLFVKSCNFDFVMDNNFKHKLVGERLVTNRFYAYDYFEEYHGVKVILSDVIESSNKLDTLILKITNNSPVLISLNSYWTPWNSFAYKKIKANHYCLVIGFNKMDKILYCLDPTYSMETLKLPFTDFVNGCTKPYVYFEKTNHSKLDTIKIFGEINQTLKNINTKAIKEFAIEIRDFFDYKKEVIEFPRLSDAPININLVKIIFSHQYLFKGLKYILLANLNLTRNMTKIMEDLNNITNYWKMIHNVISKEYVLYQRNGHMPTIKRISPIVRELGEREALFKYNFEQVYQKLIK